MVDGKGFRFVVRESFDLKKPFLLVAGIVENGDIRIGEECELVTLSGERFVGKVDHIETHTRPGETVLGITGPAAQHLERGAVIETWPT
jgi:hypothetical protein